MTIVPRSTPFLSRAERALRDAEDNAEGASQSIADVLRAIANAERLWWAYRQRWHLRGGVDFDATDEERFAAWRAKDPEVTGLDRALAALEARMARATSAARYWRIALGIEE